MIEKVSSKTKFPRLETLPLAEIKPHPDALRSAQPLDVYRLSQSLAKFGLLRPPLVVNARTGTLLDGERALEALRSAGETSAPVWLVEVEPELEDAAHLALQNHVGEWRWQQVSEALKELKGRGVDVGLTGFHDSDTGPLLAADWSPAEKAALEGGDPNQVEMF
jgi:ParB-like chromosome segregation protein Spo0J